MRYAQFYPRLVMMYAYGRAPVADPCPHMDTAATAGWRVDRVWVEEKWEWSLAWYLAAECPASAQTLCPTLPCWTARGGELRRAHGNFSLRLWLEQ